MVAEELGRARLAVYLTLTALSVLSASAVAVTVPDISADLGLREAGAGWVLASFTMGFPVGTVAFGRIVDGYGQRQAWRWGATLFVGGSLLAAVAPGFWVLVAGRLLQGLGTGAIPTLTLSRVSATGDPARRTGRVGLVTVVVSVTSGVGPLLGGAIATSLHWRVVLALPVTALLLAPVIVPDLQRRPVGGGRLDVVGGLLTLATLGAILTTLRGLVDVTGSTLAAWAGGSGCITALGLTLWLRGRPEGFLRRDLLADRGLLVSGFAVLTMLASHVGAVFAVPLLLSAERGWTAFQIGVSMVPAALLSVGAAAIAPRFQRRFSARYTALAAALACLVGVLLLASGSSALVVLIGGLGLVGVGGLGGQVVHTARVLRPPDDPLAASAMGLFQLLLFSGAALGPVLVGAVAQAVTLRAGIAALLPLPVVAAVLAGTLGEGPGNRGADA